MGPRLRGDDGVSIGSRVQAVGMLTCSMGPRLRGDDGFSVFVEKEAVGCAVEGDQAPGVDICASLQHLQLPCFAQLKREMHTPAAALPKARPERKPLQPP